MIFLEAFKQHILSVFVWNVPNHDSCSSISFNVLNINHIGSWFFIADGSTVADSWTLSPVVVTIRKLHHHRHSRGWVAGVDVVVKLGSLTLKGVSSSDGIRAVFCVFCDHSHAWVDNCAYHLILFLAFRRLTSLSRLVGWIYSWFLLVLVLKQKDSVVKGLLAIGWSLSTIASGDAQLRKGVLLLLFVYLGDVGSRRKFGVLVRVGVRVWCVLL